ncbi:sensor histidine kinase [Okeanomitos corallinicola TIOX110]|uniref:Sensor histidine kinase n=1 Tax=Okeanomitos corallinicola TIOX110 TaxID=3133117 RepID=A0ABZ2UMB8_9CYAN
MILVPTILDIVAGICLYTGFLHLLITSRGLKPALHFCFGLTCLVISGYILALITQYKTINIDDYISAKKLVTSLGYISGILVVWFVALYTNIKQVRVILVLNSLYLISLLINQISPTGILYSHISSLSSISLPWGESITHPQGIINPLFIVQLLTLNSNISYCFFACYRQYRSGEKQASLTLVLSLILLIATVLCDRLIDLGKLKFIYIAGFGFLSFVMIMSLSLTNDLMQVVKLRQQLLESDHLRKIAVEEERNRLARDLHDSVSQTLFSVATIAETVPRVWQRHPEIAQEKLEELAGLAQGALAEMRSLLIELRPSGLRDKLLGELLKQLTKAVQGRAKIQIITTVTGDQPLPEEVKLVFYRVTQEALNNIIKYAQSTQVDVTFQGNSEYIKLSIFDNGCGFDVKDTSSGHLGIEIMRERAESIGANFQLESSPGKGTKIVLILVNK